MSIDKQVCKCHGELVKRAKGSYLGEYVNVCSITEKECEVVEVEW